MALRIAVLAALPQETGPLQGLYPGWRPLTRKPFRLWLYQPSGKQILLMETGVGNEAAERAAVHLLGWRGPRALPDLILSMGFAGALSPDLGLGQVVYSGDLAVYDHSSGSCQVRYRCAGSLDNAGLLESMGVRPARFITVDRLRSKAMLALLVPGIPAVTEMESASIAAVAHAHGIPFLGLRAISDELAEEIEWDLDSIVDTDGRLSLSRVALALLREPRRAGSFPQLYRGSRIAGRGLAHALAGLLALQEEDLRILVGQLQVGS